MDLVHNTVPRSSTPAVAPSWMDKVKSIAFTYPIAILALIGIIAGSVTMLFDSKTAHIVFAVVAVGCGAPLVWRNVAEMLKGRFYVDTIASLAIVGSVALGQYFAGSLVVLMQSGGQAIEDYGLRRANRSLDNLLRRAPSIAHRQEGKTVVDVAAAAVAVGDVLLIRPGDIIAADGIVLEGCGSVDEAALTGEPVPLPKTPGDHVYSGAVNLNGNFLIRAVNTALESKYELIVRMVQRAQGERAPINRLANEYTPLFTVVTLVVSGVAFLLTHDPIRALSVLVVATPCPLIIATPLAVLSAVNRAASANIIVKSGAAIEQAGRVQLIAFDKTGTLTSGQPALARVQVLDESFTSDDILALCAPVEMHSVHVLAESVVREAHNRGQAPEPASDIVEVPGKGIAGSVDGHRVAVGSSSFVQSQGFVVDEETAREAFAQASAGKMVAYAGVDGDIRAILLFEDSLRPEARAAISRLRDLGIRRIVLLTGDTVEAAGAIARQVGIEEYSANLLPDEKVSTVAKAAESSTIMMVGDGINDAPALATASVGVALGGHGAGIATDAADIVITVDNVERVADVIEIGRRMLQVARQGIFLGIGASLGLMIFASAGYIPPATGAILQEFLDLATILNALRAR